jgi:hypothetical protein
MQIYVGQIKSFLEDYRRKAFTGGIKMAFEEGKPMTFWISDIPDFKDKPVEEGFDLDKKLSMAASGTFTGTLFFLMEKGEIKHFYHNETIQGRRLLARLDGYRGGTAPHLPERRAVIAVRAKR